MLIEFKVENFRSFKSAQTLSMVSGSSADQRKTNTVEMKGIGRVLRSAVVYGPNAAGKTNLLRAVQVMREFVVSSASFTPGTPPPYTPFKLSKTTAQAPSEFQITFAQNEVRYNYGFTVDQNRVSNEWLVEYTSQKGRMLFERTYNDKKKEYDWKLSRALTGPRTNWTQSTRPEELFLSKAIQLNNTQLLPVFHWFQKRLVIIGPAGLNAQLTLKLLDTPDGKTKLLPFIRAADFDIDDVKKQSHPLGNSPQLILSSQFLEQREPNSPPSPVKILFSHKSDDGEDVPIDFSDESNGTQRLFLSAGAWLNVFANGEVLLFDELDTSLHPKLTRFLIGQFHSNKTNQNNAQLICTTHDTSLLDREVFRRDQFWFVEKQKRSGSNLYPLTDFHPRGDDDIEKWYMRGKYGAVPVLPNVE